MPFSIRTRLIFIIGVILVAGFVTTNLISFRVSADTLKATILENELPLTSSNIYSEIQADLLRPIYVSSQMANDTFVKDWLLEGEQGAEAITRYLEAVRERYGVFTAFVVSDRTRRYYHFTGPTQVIDEADPEDIWFFRVRAMEPHYEINIDYNQAQANELTIFVNYRLLDYDGRFLAVTGVGLKIDAVARVLERFREGGRTVYFIDRAGTFTVPAEGLSNFANIHEVPGLGKVADKLLSEDTGYFEYQRGGETRLLTARLIPQLGWYVVVEQSEDEALRNLWRGFLTNLAVGLGIVILTIAVIGYFVSLYHRQLEDMATTDKLTGVGNRQFFDLSIAQAIKIFRRSGRPFSVILADIDHFKEVNDSLGHLQGDLVIRAVTEVIRTHVRESDVLCRWGGEELIILAADCRLEPAVELAEKLRRMVETSTFGNELRITASFGVAEVEAGEDADGIIGRADDALYEAKDSGRNRVVAAGVPAERAAAS